MTPEFSSTIFFCRWKNGTSVGHTSRDTGAPVQTVENRRAIRGFDLLIKDALADTRRDQRAFRAQPHAAHALDLAVAFGAAARDFLIERVFHRLALAREASGRDAHVHALR